MMIGQYDSDAELVEGLRRSEDAAAEVFVDRYLPVIVTTLRRIMKSQGEGQAADLDEQSIIVAHRLILKVAGSEPRTNLRGFVARSAHNAGIDWYRKEKKRRLLEAATDASEISPEHVHHDAQNDPKVHAADYVPINAQAAEVFERALLTLDPQEQQLLSLHASGTSYEEISEFLRDDSKPVKEATWRKRHQRAYAKLLEACRKLAEGNSTVLRALDEGQQQIREQKRRTETEGS